MVPKPLRGSVKMIRYGQPFQLQVAHDVRDSSVEEDGCRLFCGDAVGTHFPAEHQFGEQGRICPGQRSSADANLVLVDPAPRLLGPPIAPPLQVVDQGALPGPRPPVRTMNRSDSDVMQ